VLGGLLGRIWQLGEYFLSALQGLARKHSAIRDVRGLGLMLAVEIDSAETAKSIVGELLARGILINRTQEKVLRFLPPYIIETEHIDRVIEALDRALASAGAPGAWSKSPRQREIRRKELLS
jgi:acetylornithine aminotransferase/acetylornithine/N-succinyldiaminopimelate aminotransferase